MNDTTIVQDLKAKAEQLRSEREAKLAQRYSVTDINPIWYDKAVADALIIRQLIQDQTGASGEELALLTVAASSCFNRETHATES